MPRSYDAGRGAARVLALLISLGGAASPALAQGSEAVTPGGGPAPWLIVGAVALGLGLAGYAAFRRWGSGGSGASRARAGEDGPDRSVPVQDRVLGMVTVRSGPLRGNRFPVPASGLRIGRDSSVCQVVLSEITVSRQHTLIGSDEDRRVMVRNLSTTNPTYVNDRAVQETILRSGDRIRIGASVLEFEGP